MASSEQSKKIPEANNKVESKNLLSWLNKMKDIWTDFPVYRQIKNNDNIFTKKYFESCQFDKIEKLEEGLFQNENGSLVGTGVLTFDKKGSSCLYKLGIYKINGTFARGQLEGMATIYFNNGSFFRAPFSNGAISGLARSFSCLYGACDFDYEAWNKPSRLSEVNNMKYQKKVKLGNAGFTRYLISCISFVLVKIDTLRQTLYLNITCYKKFNYLININNETRL